MNQKTLTIIIKSIVGQIPISMAIPVITVRKATIIGILNIDLSSITSVKLAPALPIIKAINAPVPIPFSHQH